ncbi:DUF805 domain-containing protein [bacterium]|nr:DUF805 domain-containing protein [bacterium]
MNELISFFTNILNFSGKTNQKGYIIPLVVCLIVGLIFGGALGTVGKIIAIIVFIATISLTVRRLHDSGHTGWWALLFICPPAGLVLEIILCFLPSK